MIISENNILIGCGEMIEYPFYCGRNYLRVDSDEIYQMYLCPICRERDRAK